MAGELKLEVLVCAFGRSGLESAVAMSWPKVEGVEYLVACQNPRGDEVLDLAWKLHSRGDTIVLLFSDSGLSVNRNHALDAASAPYVLLTDDDVELRAEGLMEIIRYFDTHPDVGLLTMRMELPDLKEERVYPADGHDLAKRCRNYYVISVEIALRRGAWAASGVRFSPLAGIGAPMLGCGEEEIFVHNLLKHGVKGRFAGILVGRHSGATTAENFEDTPRVLRARGAGLRVLMGWFGGLVRIPVNARRSRAGFFKALRYISEGYVYSLIHRKEL